MLNKFFSMVSGRVLEVKLWEYICNIENGMRKYLRKLGSAAIVGINVISNPSVERVINMKEFFLNNFILLVSNLLVCNVVLDYR